MTACRSTRPLPLAIATLMGLVIGVVLLAGCAQMQIKRLATPDGSEVYELRGRDPGRLAAEASQRCLHGYDTLRQSQKSSMLESPLKPAQLWNDAQAYLEDAGSQSQLLVACKAPPPATAVTAPLPAPAPGPAAAPASTPLPLPVITDGSAK